MTTAPQRLFPTGSKKAIAKQDYLSNKMKKWVQNRAYHLWEINGSPVGDGLHFWVLAENEYYNILDRITITHELIPQKVVCVKR